MTDPAEAVRTLYERVRKHLLRQGRRATHSGKCAYRTPDGLTCAVGCLVAPADYDPNMEGATVDQLVALPGGRWVASTARTSGDPSSEGRATALAAALNASGVQASPAAWTLLSRLQEVHDLREPDAWPAKLDLIREELP